jgi:hypothetical protein
VEDHVCPLILRGWTRGARTAWQAGYVIPGPYSPARAYALMDHAVLTGLRSRDGACLGERCALLLEARHGTERPLQPALLLRRGFGSQDHGHEREFLHERGHSERRQIHDEGPARPP